MFKTIIHNASWAYFFIGLSCILFIVQAIFFPIHDFSNYYFGGDFLKRGLFDSSIYFPHEFNKNIAELGYQNLFVSYAPNSPFLALIFTPFTFLSLAYAKLVFNIISLVLFIYSLRNLVNTYELKPIFLFIIPLIFFIPLRNGFLFGQTYLLLFFLLAEGFLAYKKTYSLK